MMPATHPPSRVPFTPGMGGFNFDKCHFSPSPHFGKTFHGLIRLLQSNPPSMKPIPPPPSGESKFCRSLKCKISFCRYRIEILESLTLASKILSRDSRKTRSRLESPSLVPTPLFPPAPSPPPSSSSPPPSSSPWWQPPRS